MVREIDNFHAPIDNALMIPLPRRFRRSIWIGYWVLLFVLTHLPVSPPAMAARNADKVLHVVAYFVLTLLGGRTARRPMSTPSLLIWAGVYAAYALLDEYLQQFTKRSMSLGDWLADLLGIGMATAILVTGQAQSDSELREQ